MAWWMVTVVLTALLAALCAVALALAWIHRHRWLRWLRLAGGRVRPRYPVLLVHGVLGFDELRLGRQRYAYFRGLSEVLERIGAQVHRPRVAPLAGVAARAAALAGQIDKLAARRVNIIAHSMGGLDARYAITRLGLRRRVASLVTIGTPHYGTPIADLGGRSLLGALRRVLSGVGLPLEAFDELTTASLQRFNVQVPDAPGVFYGSVVAAADPSAGLHRMLGPSHRYLQRKVGPNDGLVPAHSQAWGEVLARVTADHWAQVGWSQHFDAPALYTDILRELRARGC